MTKNRNLVSVEQLTQHNTKDSLWIAIDGNVYDMTEFAEEHPGGADIIYAHGGKDATSAYSDVHPPKLVSTTLPPAKHMGQLDGEAISQDWKQVSQNMSSVSDNGSWEKPDLEEIINLDDFALVAQNSLSKKNWAFISGASNDNITRDANQNDYAKILFRPKVLLDVSKVSTKMTLLGHEVPAPFMIAPAGLATTGGSEGELALSRGAGSTGIIQIISTHASFPLVDILKAAPDHPFFFQLYINKNRHKTEQLLQTINSEPQIKAIFVTVDLPVISKREADERLKNETLRISAISGSRSSSDNKGSGLARSIGSIVDPSFTWDDLAWLRGKTQLPILLKGVQSAFDARKAMAVGCDGIVISNHGGRALDSAPSSLLVLLELHKQCPEVFGTMDVFIDGGIRRGSDILKALCLGAKGVGLGRTFMYALGYGAEGVKHAINLLRDELETAMRLCGLQNLDQASPEFVNTAALDNLVPQTAGHPYARKHASSSRASRL